MSRSLILERIKEEVEPTEIEPNVLYLKRKPFLDLKDYVFVVDKALEKVKDIMEEGGFVEISIVLNMRFNEEWIYFRYKDAEDMKDEDWEFWHEVVKHLKVYWPLVLYAASHMSCDTKVYGKHGHSYESSKELGFKVLMMNEDS